MHHGFDPSFAARSAEFLGYFYLALALMNATAAFYLWQGGKDQAGNDKVRTWFHVGGVAITNVLGWLTLSMLCVILSAASMGGAPPKLPEWFIRYANAALTGNPGAIVYTLATTAGLCAAYYWRRFFVKPVVAWSIFNASLLLMGLAMTNRPFWEIVAKPDNVPIVALVFLLGFFTWLATYKSVINDDRAAEGLPPLEKEDNEKVLVWPDLVYTELICMIALTALLLIWAILLKAPLEEPASAVKTPNPSKAPWYFLGLQEMLVYYDPWMAGVVLPSLVIVGLMAIPYLDFNKKGNGYYTISQRRFAYIIFQVGFLELWVTLIVLGTFLRGPNWNFFGPFEEWDAHKVLVLNNIDLSQIFWNDLMGTSVPTVSSDMGTFESLGVVIYREWLGLLSVALYFIVLPPLLATTVFRKFFIRMGFIRYMAMVVLLLFMASLPIKMALRWAFNLKYIVAIPEFFFNI